MANNIIEKTNIPITNQKSRQITLHDKSKYFEHVDTVNVDTTINFTTSINGQIITSNIKANNNFYNLFVLDGEDFTKGYFIIKRNEALKYLDKESMSLHSLINFDSLKLCKSYPCIFANKNQHKYKTASKDQKLFFGYLADIEKTDEGFKFSFSFVSSLLQQLLNDNTKQFNLRSSKGDNELDIVHWSIKNTNIIEVIRSLGFNVAAY